MNKSSNLFDGENDRNMLTAWISSEKNKILSMVAKKKRRSKSDLVREAINIYLQQETCLLDKENYS